MSFIIIIYELKTGSILFIIVNSHYPSGRPNAHTFVYTCVRHAVCVCNLYVNMK